MLTTIDNPFEDEVAYSKKVLDGIEKDETVFSLLYEPDNVKNWETSDLILKQANPGALEIPEIWEDLLKKRTRAIAIESARENFVTKHCKLDIKDLQEENAELLEEIATLENHREYLQNICKAENEKLKKLKESLAIKKASVNAILERIAIKRELIKKAMQQKIELNNLMYQGIGKIQLLRGKLELINTDLERTQNQIKETKWNTELM